MIYKPFFVFLQLVSLSTLITLALAITNMVPPPSTSYYLQEIQDQRVTIEETTRLYEDTLHQLQTYEATEADLIAIGASLEQSQAIISASNLYHISGKR